MEKDLIYDESFFEDIDLMKYFYDIVFEDFDEDDCFDDDDE